MNNENGSKLGKSEADREHSQHEDKVKDENDKGLWFPLKRNRILKYNWMVKLKSFA